MKRRRKFPDVFVDRVGCGVGSGRLRSAESTVGTSPIPPMRNWDVFREKRNVFEDLTHHIEVRHYNTARAQSK